MQQTQCHHCASTDVRVKDIEIRHINSHTMALNGKEKVQELECLRCGWVISLGPMPVNRATFLDNDEVALTV